MSSRMRDIFFLRSTSGCIWYIDGMIKGGDRGMRECAKAAVSWCRATFGGVLIIILKPKLEI